MKRKFLQFLANAYFWLGDKAWRVSVLLDSGRVFNWYQWLMTQSMNVQNRHDLPKPWSNTFRNKGENS